MNFLFRDACGGPLRPHGSVVCIGAFDGLHLGHRALLRHARERARALDLPAVALAFEPLPREFFAAGDPPPRLMLARDKVQGLREASGRANGWPASPESNCNPLAWKSCGPVRGLLICSRKKLSAMI